MKNKSAAKTCSIRLAQAGDAAILPGIEASAGELFKSLPDLAWIADEPIGSAEDFLPAIAAGTVWLADDQSAGVIGELRGEIFGDVLHIVELAVVKDFQQRGVGRHLLDTVSAVARARGLKAITLTTFRHVAWNAPFYARHGFVELSGAELGERLRETVRAEEARGLPNRCAMRLELR
jgi:GNAT superfamily N-acetyltransferase